MNLKLIWIFLLTVCWIATAGSWVSLFVGFAWGYNVGSLLMETYMQNKVKENDDGEQ